MTTDLTPLAFAAAGILLLLVLGKVAMVPAMRLRISVFHPWRGDPWPVGIQEDDDARFSWAARRHPISDGFVGGSAADDAAGRVAVDGPLGIVDESTADVVDTEPLHADVRRARADPSGRQSRG